MDVSFEVWPTKIKKLGQLELHLYHKFWAAGFDESRNDGESNEEAKRTSACVEPLRRTGLFI